jgi:hypothetical protein
MSGINPTSMIAAAAASSSSSSTVTPVNKELPLPAEVRLMIYQRLDQASLLSYRMVCGDIRRDLKDMIDPLSTKNFFVIAARHGYLELMKYVHEEKKTPLRGNICAAAAKGGHLNVLQWARENDCPCPCNE